MHQDELFLRAKWAGRLEERARIARELHDTLLQSNEGLILQIQSSVNRLQAHDPIRHQIESALDQAARLLGEARERVWHLRSSTYLSNLASALERDGNTLASRTALGFTLNVLGKTRCLRPTVAGEIYAIAREAMNNAFAHSKATTVSVKISFGATCFLARIIDDGRGLPPGATTQSRGDHHFGVQGMRERARELGARLTIRSKVGAGTEIKCTIPAATAYADSPTSYALYRVDRRNPDESGGQPPIPSNHRVLPPIPLLRDIVTIAQSTHDGVS
jgi:signal transduction histidine kinase